MEQDSAKKTILPLPVRIISHYDVLPYTHVAVFQPGNAPTIHSLLHCFKYVMIPGKFSSYISQLLQCGLEK